MEGQNWSGTSGSGTSQRVSTSVSKASTINPTSSNALTFLTLVSSATSWILWSAIDTVQEPESGSARTGATAAASIDHSV